MACFCKTEERNLCTYMHFIRPFFRKNRMLNIFWKIADRIGYVSIDPCIYPFIPLPITFCSKFECNTKYFVIWVKMCSLWKKWIRYFKFWYIEIFLYDVFKTKIDGFGWISIFKIYLKNVKNECITFICFHMSLNENLLYNEFYLKKNNIYWLFEDQPIYSRQANW